MIYVGQSVTVVGEGVGVKQLDGQNGMEETEASAIRNDKEAGWTKPNLCLATVKAAVVLFENRWTKVSSRRMAVDNVPLMQ